MTFRELDPIAPHSDSLCETFNHDGGAVLTMAKHQGGPMDLVSAKVVEINQFGFSLLGHDNYGRPSQIRIVSSRPFHSLSQVRDEFASKSKGPAQQLTVLPVEIPGQPEGWRVYWPQWNPFLIALAAGVSSFFYIYFFPETQIGPLKWILQIVGIETVASCVYFAIGLHSFQTATALYLMRRVAKCSFSFRQYIIWMGVVQLFGIGSMLELLPIVYNSAYVGSILDQRPPRSTGEREPLLGHYSR